MSTGSIAKLYIMIATDGYSGTLYFDKFKTNKGTVASFDQASDLFTREQIGAETYVKTLALIGGSSKANAIIATAKASANSIIMQGNSLQLTLAQSGNVSVDLFDLQGHRAASLFSGSLDAGTHTLAMKSVNQGVYVVRAKGTYVNALQKVIVK